MRWGKEVVQVLCERFQGKLEMARKLIGFCEDEGAGTWRAGRGLYCYSGKYDMASYDDSGVTGHKSCYVLEEGCYEIFCRQ